MEKNGFFKCMVSCTLPLCLLAVALLAEPMEVKAMATQGEAVQWAKDQEGKALDWDGSYGAQCMDLIALYCEYLGVSPILADYAKDYTWKNPPTGWQSIQGASIRAGDIVILGGDFCQTGHVAIALSESKIMEQNRSGKNDAGYTPSPCQESDMYGAYWGVWRPNFNSEPQPVQPEPDPVSEYDVEDNGDDTVTITRFRGSGGGSVAIPYDIVIPSEINGKKVTGIGENAFSCSYGLTSVRIPSGVADIGEYAFSSCVNLTSVTIQEGVASIGKKAFAGCSALTNVEIPGSVTGIGDEAFGWCYGLTGMVIPEGVASIGEQAFYDCRALESVFISKSVKHIGKRAFASSGLKSVSIPEGVATIGEEAFQNSSLESVTIAGSVESIGKNAFYSCKNLESVTILGRAMNIEESAFVFCENLKSVDISGGEISIGTLAFAGCANLKNLAISGDKINIGLKSFMDCNSLESMTIPGGETIIDRHAFMSCQGLKNVTIQDGVASIGEAAFYRCLLLESVTIPGSVKNIGSSAFYGCGSLSTVTIREGVTSIEHSAFSDCGNLESITIPRSVTSIDGIVFQGSNKLYEASYNGEGTAGTVYVESGSAAEEYARKYHLRFRLISGSDPSQDGNPAVSCAHSYKISIIPATTTADGSITEKCGKCGYEKKKTAIYAASNIALSKTSFTYSGKTQKPSVTVKDSGGKVLKINTDYTVSFPKGTKNVGRYDVTVTFKGNYSGTAARTFDIVPKGTSFSKLTAGKKGFSAKWGRQTVQTTGYEISYSTNSKFSSKDTKILNAGNSRNSSKTVSGLKAGKKYYVRIRTYKTVKANGKFVKLYSGWSKAKTVTTEK